MPGLRADTFPLSFDGCVKEELLGFILRENKYGVLFDDVVQWLV